MRLKKTIVGALGLALGAAGVVGVYHQMSVIEAALSAAADNTDSFQIPDAWNDVKTPPPPSSQGFFENPYLSAFLAAEEETMVLDETSAPGAVVANCDVIPPSPDASVVAVGLHEAKNATRIVIGPRADPAGIVTVWGARDPTYLILNGSGSILWNIEDPKNMIERVLLTAGSSKYLLSGVVGIDKEKVGILEHGCIAQGSLNDDERRAAVLKDLERVAGRPIDRILQAHRAALVLLDPSIAGAVRPLLNPDTIDPADVVASHPARRILLKPERAGLFELVEMGHIAIEGSRWRINSMPPEMPTGFGGSNAQTFILSPEIDEELFARTFPNLGHSCVLKSNGKPFFGAC